MANKVTIDIEARLIDNVSRSLPKVNKGLDDMEKKSRKAEKAVDSLGKKKVQPKIEAQDSKFTKAIDRAQKRADKLGKTKANVILNAMDKASRKIDAVTSRLKAYSKGKYTAFMNLKDQGASAVLKSVLSKTREFANKTWKATLKITDMATAPIRKIYNSLFSLKTLAMGIFAGAAAQKFIMKPIELADTIEGAKIAFETKLGSAEAAQKQLESIYKFDEKSPFDTIQIVGITQQMMNMGWEAENVLQDLEVIGDWAASMGKGEEGIQRVTLALGQMRQKGKLSSEEMLQLTEAGVSGWDYLAQSMGKTIPEVRKMAEKGEIDVNKAIAGILQGMEEFKGAAAANSDRTVQGIMGQIDSLIGTYIRLPWGEGLSEGLKEGLGDVRDILDQNKEDFKDWGKELKAIGSAVSTWLADKLKTALAIVKEITSSAEFKEAGAGKKMSMLFKGLITDPLADWWENGGAEGMMKTAVDIGAAIAKGIAKGFASIMQESPGTALALGGFGLAKAVGGGSALAGAGKMLSKAAATGSGILGNAANFAIMAGAGNLAGGASLGAGALAGLGLAGTAGGVAGGVSLLSGAMDLYQGFKNDDTAKKKSGGWKVGGTAAGAAAGAAIGSVIPGLGTAIGGLIGAGVGGIGGWIAGKKSADKYSESVKNSAAQTAKLSAEQEKLAKKSMDKHFGDMALSADEMAVAVSNILGSDKVAKGEKLTATFENMDKALENFKMTDQNLQKQVWMAGLKNGAKLTATEIQGLQSATQSFTKGATDYVTESQYAAEQSISLIMGNSKEAEKLITSTRDYYNEQKGELQGLSKELNTTMSNALKDGVISIDEQKSIDKIRGQIAEITAQLAKDKYEANLNIIQAQYGAGNLTPESFEEMQKATFDAGEKMAESYWDAFGQASIGKSEEEKEKLKAGVYEQLATLWTDAGNLGFNTLREQYAEELGTLGQDIGKLFEEGVTPEVIAATNRLAEDEETRAAIGKMLDGMKPTTEKVEEIKAAYEKMGMEVPAAINNYLNTAEFYEALSKGPKAVQEYLSKQEIKGHMNITIGTNGKLEFHQIEKQPEGKDFGVPDNIPHNMGIKVTGEKDIQNIIHVTARDFGIPKAISTSVKIGVNPIVEAAEAAKPGQKFRGGIVGANIPGFSGGGMVKGGSQLVRVAEEGDPEVIIPLSSRRRDRAMQLWKKTGEMLGADHQTEGYAAGGFVGTDEPEVARTESPQIISGSPSGPSNIEVNVGGITVEVKAEGNNDVLGAVQAQKEQLAEEIAGILNRAIEAQYRNMPSRQGA